MAKFHGQVGFLITEFDPSTGIAKPKVTTKPYSGDILKDSRNWEKGDGVNDNLIVKNRLSILGNAFAYNNLGNIKFVELYGNLWSVTSFELQYPRIILTLGGVYNGEQA